MPSTPGDHGRAKWVKELRRHHEGTLVTGERAVPVRFVFEGETGRLAMPVEKWVRDEEGGVLFMPEERFDALQVLLEFDPVEACGAAQDRWAAYHGEARERHWASARIAGVRREDETCDESELSLCNPLRRDESRLLRLLNSQRAALGGACKRYAGVVIPEPCAVGVDPHGVDVRARFGIVRVEFPGGECPDAGGIECPDRAAEVLRRLMESCG